MMKLSLGGKIVLLVILLAILLSGTGIIVCGVAVRKMMKNEYAITGDSMARTVAAMIDAEQMQDITDKIMERYRAADNKMDNTQWDEPGFEEYAEQFYPLIEEESYLALHEIMKSIQEASEIDCAYSLCIDPENKTAVYIVDGADPDDEDFVSPGCFDLVEPVCYQYLDDLSQGFPAFISNTPEYGWMVTSCAPIFNADGEVICFSAVDLSMNDIMGTVHNFLISLSIILIALTVMLCILAILYVRYRIVRPINMLSEAAGHYSKQQVTGIQHEFSALHIHTGDELEILLRSMVKMEEDIGSYIDSLTQTREQLSTARRHANDMHELAHMDSLTGIRNRLAYDNEVMRLEAEMKIGMKKFGIAVVDLNFLKRINDTYGHERGNAAIVGLTKMTCNIFTHSPVFRIGGDEFAVVLKNHDYDHITELLDEFNGLLAKLAADDSLQPWEKISAAVGYAFFDPEQDHCVDDVFKRADQKMYEQKKAMKAERKS